MAERKRILIGCPQHRMLVSGSYGCDDRGRYLLADDGTFLLPYARCDHHGGKCMQTLCVLHRYNNGGPGSWYPETILAAPEPPTSPLPARTAQRQRCAGGVDLLA